jgi:hypothetical protein
MHFVAHPLVGCATIETAALSDTRVRGRGHQKLRRAACGQNRTLQWQ